jgi:ribosome assembly protein YihI (activator of Der GTPase)
VIKNFEEFKNDSQIVTEGKLLDRILSSINGAVTAYKVDKKREKAIEDEVNKITANKSEYDLDTQLAVCVDSLLTRVMFFSERFADGKLSLEKPEYIDYALERIEELISKIKEIKEKSEK